MAFHPEDGYLMVMARAAAPGDSQKSVERQEVETLVDPRNIPAFTAYLERPRA